jgi:hypothetical protein
VLIDFDRLKLVHPQTGEAHSLNYLTDDRDELKILLTLNRELVNDPTLGPNTVWRKMFENIMDKKIYKRNADSVHPALRNPTPAAIASTNEISIFHPVGFTLKNNIIVVQNPNWRSDTHTFLDMKPITGDAFLPRERVVALVPQGDVEKGRLPEGKNFHTLTVPAQALFPVKPYEGLYENGAFLISIPELLNEDKDKPEWDTGTP